MSTDEPGARSGVKRRGFGSMDPELQRMIAKKGGAAVPARKRSFSQDRSLAAAAGRKGGLAHHAKLVKTDEAIGQKSLLDGLRPQREF